LFNINKTKLINNKFQMNSFQDLRPLSQFSTFQHSISFFLGANLTPPVFLHA